MWVFENLGYKDGWFGYSRVEGALASIFDAVQNLQATYIMANSKKGAARPKVSSYPRPSDGTGSEGMSWDSLFQEIDPSYSLDN